MKINCTYKSGIKFKDIWSGTVFWHNSVLYMKIPSLLSESGRCYRAVILASGCLADIDNDTIVTLANVKIVYA